MKLALLQNLIFAICHRLRLKQFSFTPKALRKSFSGNDVDKIIAGYLPNKNAKFVNNCNNLFKTKNEVFYLPRDSQFRVV